MSPSKRTWEAGCIICNGWTIERISDTGTDSILDFRSMRIPENTVPRIADGVFRCPNDIRYNEI
jgi:hypothetical protein